MFIHDDSSGVHWDQAAHLFELVGWLPRSAADLQLAFSRSIAQAFAFHESRLVGLARAVGDGVYYAQLVDVLVHPGFQRARIGSKLVEYVQARLEYPLLFTLTAAPEVQPFYQRLGWRLQSTSMIRPRSSEQEALNCPQNEGY